MFITDDSVSSAEIGRHRSRGASSSQKSTGGFKTPAPEAAESQIGIAFSINFT
jgi:hypothetical protein